MKNLTLLLLVSLFSFQVLADQCAWNDRGVAQRARAELVKHNHYLAYCEPCDDMMPTVQLIHKESNPKVETNDMMDVHFRARPMNKEQKKDKRKSSYWQFEINKSYGFSTSIDLAYIFVNVDGIYTNLAKIAKCPVEGVSMSIPNGFDYLPTGLPLF